MGKRSTRENKNIYQLSREAMELTREQAGELLEFISPDKIEKIESEKMMPHPEDVLAMSRAYKVPQMCNYYCSHECPIGQIYVPELKMKDLSGIILEMIATLNNINKEKDRLIEITADGQITEDEYEDFKKIRDQLSKISMSVDTLSLWVDKSIADGKISEIIKE